VVHGGEKFREPIKLTNRILKQLEKYNEIAPLHNPFNILGIKVSKEVFPRSQQFAVFDTEFYRNLPEKVYTYALPESLTRKYKFRKYGFHGISHEYVAGKAAKIVKKPLKKLKIISCHLGGGASITAIKYGKAIDTSMGFTPMEGLVMMTRCGDIDPGILLYLVKSSKLKVQSLSDILNCESGVKGICKLADMKEVLRAAEKGNKKAKLALEVFVYRVQKYIGSYFGILDGCDIIIFTGAIGFGSKKIREKIYKGLNILNNTKILAIKTDEEFAIAKKIKNL